MTDDQQAEEQVVTETPQSPMPSDEQKTPESQEVEQDAPQEESVKPESEQVLPDEAKDRTKREFEKLRRDLHTERTRREQLESRFQSMQPKAPALPPVYDPETGLLNEQALSQRDRLTQEALERAARAEEAVSNYEKVQEERELFSTYKELDPNGEKFDEELSHQVAAIKLHSMVSPEVYGGKQLSAKEAADFLSKRGQKALEAVKQQGAKEAIEQLSPKEQAALEATSSSGRRTQVSNLDDLRSRSRKGDNDAIMERLKALG